jgi:hypothetical protein
MKIKQIIQAPPKLMILCNDFDEDGSFVTSIEHVIAYALMDNGEVLPLIEGEKGNLEPINKELFIRTWFEGEE